MEKTDDILAGKYPAKAHAKKVADYLVSKGANRNGIIYLEGQKTRMLEDSDGEAPFRQRRPFFYLSGCPLPDSYLTYDISADRLTLFIPPMDPASVMWSGLPVTPDEALALYDVDAVLPSTALTAHLTAPDPPPGTVYALANNVSTPTTFHQSTVKDLSALGPAIAQSRVVKDGHEIALIRRANAVSTAAHHAVIGAARRATNERELQAVFLERCVALGCPEQAYPGIFASGTNAATLHYGRNDQPLAGRRNVLVDAGAEAACYASDITRTVPLSGRFDRETRAVYNVVLRMQDAALALCRAGLRWEDAHEAAHRAAVDGLLELGILRAGSARDILDARTSTAFFPHGLGHYLGMDTHDTGGNADYADKDPMFSFLRVRGTLPAGSVITVEPGVYFCRFIIEPFLKDDVHGKFIDEEVLGRYWDVGGVRIEDDILITEDGYENLTPTVKDMDAIEKMMMQE